MARPSHNPSAAPSLLYVTGAIATLSLSFAAVRAVVPLLIWLVPMGCGLCGLWAWRRYQWQLVQRQKALDGVFYELLRQHQGRMMVLDLAIATQLTAAAAQQYLDTKAREFTARYEVTQTGDVFYTFPTLQLPVEEFQEEFQRELSASSPLPAATPFTQTQLAQRLGVSPDTIRRRKHLPDWSTWSQRKDPAAIAWIYLAAQQRFVPGDQLAPDQLAPDQLTPDQLVSNQPVSNQPAIAKPSEITEL